MNKIIVAPSILSADFANLEKDIKKVEKFGADWIHIDVMDGHFVPNITIGANVVKAVRKITDLPLDVHLMIENPDKYLDDFINAGSDIITFHYEAAKDDSLKLIKKLQHNNIKVGVSIKPKTEVNEIKNLINDADLILIMTVEPGFGGQSFINDCADKISEVKQIATKDLYIEVDGGINNETGKICVNKGANALVAGSYIYKSDDIKKAIESLK